MMLSRVGENLERLPLEAQLTNWSQEPLSEPLDSSELHLRNLLLLPQTLTSHTVLSVWKAGKCLPAETASRFNETDISFIVRVWSTTCRFLSPSPLASRSILFSLTGSLINSAAARVPYTDARDGEDEFTASVVRGVRPGNDGRSRHGPGYRGPAVCGMPGLFCTSW